MLCDLHVSEDTILVSIDVESLYPSIPPTECLHIETHKHRHLMLFDPNLVIQLPCINYNYFEFVSK